MSLHHRFIHTMASVWVATYAGKRDGVAAELKEKLEYGDEVDLGPTVSRYLNFDLTKSQHFAPMRLVFWEGVVCGDYPLHFLRWWEDAYAAYDLVASTKREKAEIRTLLAEAKKSCSRTRRTHRIPDTERLASCCSASRSPSSGRLSVLTTSGSKKG